MWIENNSSGSVKSANIPTQKADRYANIKFNMLFRDFPFTFHLNTPARLRSHNNAISSKYQQYSGRISKFSYNKTPIELSKYVKKHFFLLFWRTATIDLPGLV